MTPPPDYAAALGAFRAGDLASAETSLRRVLRRYGSFAPAWQLLGLVAVRRGDVGDALSRLAKAAQLEPQNAEIMAHLAEAHRRAGQLEAARAAAERAVRLAPRFAAAHNNLGLVHENMEDLEAARASLEAAVLVDPGYAKAQYNLGQVLLKLEEAEAAEVHLRRAALLQPDYASAWTALGVTLAHQFRHGEAEEAFRRALALRPDGPKVHLNQGIALVIAKRYDDALQCFRQALALKPDYPEALIGQGRIYAHKRQHAWAVDSYRLALAAKPDWAEAMQLLGGALFELEEYSESKTVLLAALQREPDRADIVATLLRVLSNTCDWDDLESYVERLRQATDEALAAGKVSPISSSQANAYDFSMAEKLAIARAHSRELERRAAPERARLDLIHPQPAGRPERLRIGYWSYDLRNHATAHLMQTLFGLHDRQRFEVCTYSYGPDDGSDYRAKIAAESDRFVDLREATDADCARRIHGDGVHILVDLMGYVANCRPDVLALRPAPIQVNYLGYPGTMGADFMDYILTDRVVTPPGQVPYLSEAVVCLPDTYQVTDDTQAIDPHPVTRADEGLPDEGVVYCCFNTLYKIEPVMFGAWMRILAAVPGSILWMLAKGDAVRANLRREAERQGVDPGRLVFGEGKHKPLHLARFRLADLFLDTRLYNAHTTTSDALWAGVPVLTWPGEGFPARVAASLLTAFDLPELIMPSLEAYEAEAIRLGTDAAALAALKERLAEHRTTRALFNTPRFTRAIERAYDAMWARFAAGKPPGPIAVTRD